MYWWWQAGELAAAPGLTVRARVANRRGEQEIRSRRLDYGADPRQHLLLFEPPAGMQRRSTTVFFVHGGGWYTGSPDEYSFVGHLFARQGYPTVLPGYRLVPDHTYPTQHDDVLAAFTRYQTLAGEWGVPGRVVVGGQSAGAHLASFLVGQGDRLRALGHDVEAIRGAFFVSGPLDFAVPGSSAWGRRLLRRFLGEGHDWHETDPGSLADAWEVPLFIVHGDHDPLVTLGSALSFARHVHRHRPGLVEFVVAPGRHHADLTYMFIDDLAETRALRAWLARLEEQP